MSNLAEPMISEEPSRDPVMEVASSTDLMKKVIQEWIVRLMFEHGSQWERFYYAVISPAKEAAFDEVLKSKVIKESEAPF